MDFAKHIKPLSSESDWPVWKRKIRDLLDYQEGAIDVIEGKLSKPESLGDQPTKDKQIEFKTASDLFRKANSYAKSLISCTVSDSVYQKIMDKVSAHEAWEALKQEFEATSKDQLFKVCAEFFAFNWTQGDDVSTHLAKLRRLWNELNYGLKSKNENQLPDLILICKVLHVLPISFDLFKASWMLLSKDKAKTFEELSLQLNIFERNVRQPSPSDDTSNEALFAKLKVGNSGKTVSKEDRCNYCNEKGHWVTGCPKWHADGRPPRDKFGQNLRSSSAAMVEPKIAL